MVIENKYEIRNHMAKVAYVKSKHRKEQASLLTCQMCLTENSLIINNPNNTIGVTKQDIC